jgi:hypothetical protein
MRGIESVSIGILYFFNAEVREESAEERRVFETKF